MPATLNAQRLTLNLHAWAEIICHPERGIAAGAPLHTGRHPWFAPQEASPLADGGG
ncbi:MAG: hypothetical protein M0Q87_09375 [Ottowia sp.]|nr:hypothetical protein [Ottowia sp.]